MLDFFIIWSLIGYGFYRGSRLLLTGSLGDIEFLVYIFLCGPVLWISMLSNFLTQYMVNNE